MKFKEFGLVFASLAVSFVGMGINSSSAQAGTFFGESLQHFDQSPDSDPSDVSVLKDAYKAEQDFIKQLTGGYATLNFEAEEGFTELNQLDENGKVRGKFKHNLSLKDTNGGMFDLTIKDRNKGGKNQSWKHTSVKKGGGVHKVKTNEETGEKYNYTNVMGGRYGISDANKTKEERLNNQFLNTNAGSDSSLEFLFSEATSAFGFWGLDFERGGLMGYELTRMNGKKEYISLDLTDAQEYKDRGDTIRGTAFFSGYIAESEEEYFKKVKFKLKDGVKNNHDIVGFDRMTFASPTLKKNQSFAKAVPEPGTGLLALGAVVSGAAFKRRKKK